MSNFVCKVKQSSGNIFMVAKGKKVGWQKKKEKNK
jgi:hypothetical protein